MQGYSRVGAFGGLETALGHFLLRSAIATLPAQPEPSEAVRAPAPGAVPGPLGGGPGLGLRAAGPARVIDARAADLDELLAQGPARLVLLGDGFDAVCEPAIGRVARLATEPLGSIVVQTLGPQVPTTEPGAFRVGPIRPAWSRDGYAVAVVECLRLIAAGDAYQINLAHRLVAPFAGSALGLYKSLAATARPEFGGFLRWDDPASGQRHAVVSLSPELFLEYDPAARLVRTKPMKGTRPFDGDPAELRAAEKDRAELNMIVDLMRNDLGRVAAPGSVRVSRPRDIDAHARSVWQATATVEATLRDDRTPADLVRACFPPGSVTGAPKVRAAQIIRSLEPHARGPYCGTLIGVRPDGGFTASVLIRTAHIVGTPDPADTHAFLDAELRFAVGAGIVADSDPQAEWAETLVKARVLTRTMGLTEPD
jgi:anthranilate/para-aminobenzoate synthase component I